MFFKKKTGYELKNEVLEKTVKQMKNENFQMREEIRNLNEKISQLRSSRKQLEKELEAKNTKLKELWDVMTNKK